MSSKEKRIQKSNKTDYAYQEIRNRILDNTYLPGTVLSIRDLSSQLQISRTPVKDAINRLAYEGYVDQYQDCPAIVSKISFSDLIELVEMRECLEGFAAYCAATRRTDQDIAKLEEILNIHQQFSLSSSKELMTQDWAFHIKIATITQNQHLISSVEAIQHTFCRITIPISQSPERFQRSASQHTAILEAIKAKNSEDARDHMVNHAKDILMSIQHYRQQNVHFFR